MHDFWEGGTEETINTYETGSDKTLETIAQWGISQIIPFTDGYYNDEIKYNEMNGTRKHARNELRKEQKTLVAKRGQQN
jgi:hypothetical protein